MVLGLNEGLVECATVCVKSEVILISEELTFSTVSMLSQEGGGQKCLKMCLRNTWMAP
jgi:hypothetical protein